ncbi:MAG: DUF1080 domain-containing protein [Saprospiraceae bacterium]
MQRITYFFSLSLFLLISCQSDIATDAVITEVQPWQAIFNGKNLEGWDTTGKLTTEVKNDALHIHATDPNNNAWVFTKKKYKNFKLELEFLMADSTANSGVLFRFDPTLEGIPNRTAYEANIDWRINHQNVMGTLENAARANAIPKVDINDWQKLRIEAKYDYLQIYFNDQLICETHNRRASKGAIGLQVPISQGDDIAFKNIRLQQLPDNEPLKLSLEEKYSNDSIPLQALLTNQSLEGWHTSGAGTWTFEDDVLHGYSGNQHSYLISDKTYKNFYLKCSFKIKKEDNSGIFIRQHPDSTSITPLEAIECNIYDHNGFAHAYSTGSIVTHTRAFSKLIDYENWNEMEIFAHEDQLILTINGQKSAETYLPRKFNRTGNICLQAGTKVFSDNGPSDIYFKDIVIREMD